MFPYHPRSLRWRWQHRRAWRSHLRWVVLAFAPFFYVPLIGLAILSPGVQLARSIKLPGQRLMPAQFGISAAVVCATAVVAAAVGLWVARRLLAWRPTWSPTSRTPREAKLTRGPVTQPGDTFLIPWWLNTALLNQVPRDAPGPAARPTALLSIWTSYTPVPLKALSLAWQPPV